MADKTVPPVGGPSVPPPDDPHYPSNREVRLLAVLSGLAYECAYQEEPVPDSRPQYQRVHVNSAPVAPKLFLGGVEGNTVPLNIEHVGTYNQKLVMYGNHDPSKMPAFFVVEQIGLKKPGSDDFVPEKEGSRHFTIVVRGTDHASDWLTNLDAILTTFSGEFDGKKVHQGFGYRALEIFKLIQNHHSGVLFEEIKKNKLRLTGHSLGGAVAVLLAVLFKNVGVDSHHVVTFGQPMVTDFDGASLWNDKIPLFRFWNEHDIVPTVPPTPVSLEQKVLSHFPPWFRNLLVSEVRQDPYYHFGALIHLTRQVRVPGKFPSCLDTPAIPVATDDVVDHHMFGMSPSYDWSIVALQNTYLAQVQAAGVDYLETSFFLANDPAVPVVPVV